MQMLVFAILLSAKDNQKHSLFSDGK